MTLIVDADRHQYTIAPLEAPSAGQRDCALLKVLLTDDTTARAPNTVLAVRLIAPQGRGLQVQTIDSGLIGVSGRPGRAFAPTLATNAAIALDFSAPFFNAYHLNVDFACSQRTVAVNASGSVLTLNSIANLLVGQRLLIATIDGARIEFATIALLGPGLSSVTLERALDSPYPIGSTVQPLPAEQAVALRPTRSRSSVGCS